MRSATILSMTALSFLAPLTRPSSAAATPSVDDVYHIVLPRRAVSAGEQVELRLVPPPPVGVRVHWSVASGATRIWLASAVYRAPYVIPVGTPPAKVNVSLSDPGVRTGATTEIELVPGSVPEAEDCLGPGQSFSTVLGDIVPEFAQVDVLPEVIRAVPPEYPKSALARGIEETIMVRALVCRTGRVLGAVALLSSARGGDEQPIPQDPKLVEAALATVRQYEFSPALASGQVIAVWIHVPVAFRR